MKKILVTLLVGSLFFSGGCLSSSNVGDNEEDKVVVCTPFPDALAIELADTFTADTGIKVEKILDGTTKILARLRIEKRHPRCDVWFGASGMIPFMAAAKEDLLASYVPREHRDIPLKKGKLTIRDHLWRWLPLDVVSQGYCYNPQVLSVEEIPKTWDELASPRWKGQIEMWDPSESGTSMLFLEASIWRYRDKDGNEDRGWDYLKKVFNNLKRYTREGKPAFSVARGETLIGLHFENQFLEFLDQQIHNDQLKDSSKNIAWYLPQDSPVLTDGIALVKNCPHPENGQRFIDFCLSTKGQKIINRYFFSLDENMSPPSGLEEGITLQTLLDRSMELDIEWMSSNYDRIQRQWQNEVEAEAD